MPDYRLSHEAETDLEDIWDYSYLQWSEKQADKYRQLLLNGCQYLANNPKLGKPFDYIIPNLFGYLVEYHFVFYVILNENEIGIVRILHGQMDLESHFGEIKYPPKSDE